MQYLRINLVIIKQLNFLHALDVIVSLTSVNLHKRVIDMDWQQLASNLPLFELIVLL